mgnify:CR=1 FL=1
MIASTVLKGLSVMSYWLTAVLTRQKYNGLKNYLWRVLKLREVAPLI